MIKNKMTAAQMASVFEAHADRCDIAAEDLRRTGPSMFTLWEEVSRLINVNEAKAETLRWAASRLREEVEP